MLDCEAWSNDAEMADYWWSKLTDEERALWLSRAQSVDHAEAWEAYKRRNGGNVGAEAGFLVSKDLAVRIAKDLAVATNRNAAMHSVCERIGQRFRRREVW